MFSACVELTCVGWVSCIFSISAGCSKAVRLNHQGLITSAHGFRHVQRPCAAERFDRLVEREDREQRDRLRRAWANVDHAVEAQAGEVGHGRSQGREDLTVEASV